MSLFIATRIRHCLLLACASVAFCSFTACVADRGDGDEPASVELQQSLVSSDPGPRSEFEIPPTNPGPGDGIGPKARTEDPALSLSPLPSAPCSDCRQLTPECHKYCVKPL